MRAEELDKIFDEGKEDILPYLDLAKAVRPGHRAERVNVDFPEWMIDRLDGEAGRMGVPRQSLIKVWIAEKLAAVRRAGVSAAGAVAPMRVRETPTDDGGNTARR